MVDEFSLISRFFQSKQADRTSPDWLLKGIGDDCALLGPSTLACQAISTDTLVAGVHFGSEDRPADIGYKSLAVNLSDLAAMGATPQWFTLALTLPESNPLWLTGFSEGLFALAQQAAIHLIGGDTTSGPLSVTITVGGQVVGDGLQRCHAQPGDAVFVTNTLGDAALGLAWKQGAVPSSSVPGCVYHDVAARQRVLCALHRPQPQLKASSVVKSLANAAVDLSDGLLADLAHICRESHVRAVIHCEALPLSDALTASTASTLDAIKMAVAGGDDYQLCFTVAQAQVDELCERCKNEDIAVTRIGSIVEKTPHTELIEWQYYGERIDTRAWQGYRHF